MPRKIKIKKKDELKKPDEFISLSTKAINYAKQNEKKVLVISVLVIVVIMFISFFTYYVKNSDASGYQYLSQALEKENDVKAKKELLLKVKNMKFSSASKYASFFLAQIYDNEKNVKLAKTELEKAFSIKDPYFRGAAYVYMVNLLLKENKLDEALQIIEKEINETQKPFKDELIYRKSTILEQKNNHVEAKKLYKELLKSDEEFYLAKIVRQKVED